MTRGPRSESSAYADIVIVGAGHAGAQLVFSLAQNNYAGSVMLIGDEPHQPYERPPLSKAYLKGDLDRAGLALREPAYWGAASAVLRLGQPVVALDPQTRSATLGDGEIVGYGDLVWAAGGRARRLPLPGADLDGVVYLRDLADADDLVERLSPDRKVCIIGGGYVGLEAAASLRSRGLSVCLVEAFDRLLSRVTSPPVSDHLLKIHARNGVDFRLGQAVFACVGGDGKVTGVQLANGEIIAADIVLVGIGLEPSVEVMEQAGCRIDNGVVVDADLHTGLDGIYAMGDCANFPTAFALGGHARIESIPNATAHAHALAARFSGRTSPQMAAPWFWSDQYDVKLKTVGLHTGCDRLVVRGAPESGAFSVAYLKEGRLIALDAVNSPAEFAQAKALVTQKASLDFDRLADPRIKLKDTVISLDLPNDTVSQGMDAVRA